MRFCTSGVRGADSCQHMDSRGSFRALIETGVSNVFGSQFIMDFRISYEHSLASDPNDYVIQVPAQLVDDVLANIPHELLAEFITGILLTRPPKIGKIRHLRML